MCRLGEHVEVAMEDAKPRALADREPGLARQSNRADSLLKALTPRVEVVLEVEQRVLGRSVPGRYAQQHPATRQNVNRSRLLGNMHRVAQRDDRGAGGQGNAFGVGGEETKVRERVERLPCVSERRVEGRNIARPQSCEPEFVGQFGDLDMVGHGRNWRVRVALQRQDEAQAQLARGECPGKARMGTERYSCVKHRESFCWREEPRRAGSVRLRP